MNRLKTAGRAWSTGKLLLWTAVLAAMCVLLTACGGDSRKLSLYGPGPDSGTFDYFTLAINGDEGASRTDYTPSEDDNVVVQGVRGDKNALGYLGYAYYGESSDQLKLVAVDGGDGCVLPTPQTINDGTYAPLSRPIFIYVNVASLEKPEVLAFVDFYMEHGVEVANEAGYVPLPASVYEDNLAQVRALAGEPGSGPFSGSVQIDGSSTVFPVTQAVAEMFRESGNPDVNVAVGVSGTGGGFRRFANGETDISNASRPISESELEHAEENGIEFIELRVALDGIAILVNPANDFVECLTVEELHRIWQPDSTVENWGEVREEFAAE